MLKTVTEFPHPGSQAFVRGTAERVTIVRRNADDTCLLRRDPNPGALRNRDASGNTTLPLADLFATEETAMHCGRKPRRRARRSAR